MDKSKLTTELKTDGVNNDGDNNDDDDDDYDDDGDRNTRHESTAYT